MPRHVHQPHECGGKIEGAICERQRGRTRAKDAWAPPYLYHTDREGKDYIVVSYASDGKDDELGKVGPTESYDCDIVFSNGEFIQWPGWIRKSDIR